MVGFKIKAVLGNIHKGGHAAAAQRAGPPLVVEIEGGPGQSHNGVPVVPQQLPCILAVAPVHRKNGSKILLQEVFRVSQTLVGRFGHPARGELEDVHVLRYGVGLHHRLKALLNFREKVGEHPALGGAHPLQGGEGRHVLLREPQGGQKAEIIELLLRQIFAACGHHVRLAGPQAGEEAHAQPHNRQNRQIAANALPDFPYGGAQQRFYHSISSTGTGRSLISSERTAPFFT